MKIGVAGLWHLGTMYAVGLAELGHNVIAYDPNQESVFGFRNGKLLVHEPDLQDMLFRNIAAQNIIFTCNEFDLKEVELLVLAYDTPVEEDDKADSDYVISEFKRIVKSLKPSSHILVSSQLRVGSGDIIQKILEDSGHEGNVTVQPENLRLGSAVESFFHPERIIAGTYDGNPEELVTKLFSGIDAPIIWMHRKSAEVTKHALNAFLATSVTFMGELAEICEAVGADAKEVEVGLKSDPRIGSKAYLSPGLGFAGGTLARDVRQLSDLQGEIRRDAAIFTSLLTSNRHNNDWVSRSLAKIPAKIESLRVCFWGVSYTQNTDTLRRSEIYSLMKSLVEANARISYVENLTIRDEVDRRILCINSLEVSLDEIDVLVVSKKLIDSLNDQVILRKIQSKDLWILDPSRILLELNLGFLNNPKYLTVGNGL
jgi:UDPglucose 6-dehydrogenase